MSGDGARKMVVAAAGVAGPVVGVDVGGTFTDAVVFHRGVLHAAKALTTVDQVDGVIEALTRALDAAGVAPNDVARFAHGTTVATNALLERRGVPTAGMFTEACADLLELARQDRPVLYRPLVPRPEPLIAHEHVVAVRERMTVDGVDTPLTDEAIDEALARLAALDVEAVAICLLHSYRDPTHEARLAAAVRERLPALHVVASHELTRDYREYERASTTSIDAALTPLLRPYLEHLAERARQIGLPDMLVMQSTGGLDDEREVSAHAARAVLSGPAGGMVAVAATGRALGLSEMLCFDIGGTSCDVAVTTTSGAAHAVERTVAGLPIQLDMVDIHTVGAGGSSIVSVDPGGALRVGPRSAGATPGPACYGRGGGELTLTDAHLLVGNLAPHVMRHWGVGLDVAAAKAAAHRLGIGDPVDVASGAIAIATSSMAEAARVVSVARGRDPRSMALVSYGGAGGLHACDVADELGCDTVVLPLAGGVLSALGLAAADLRRVRSRTVMVTHDAHVDRKLANVAAEVVVRAGELAADLAAHGSVTVTVGSDMRFRGQSHTIPIDVGLAVVTAAAASDALRESARGFLAEHEERYGFLLDEPVQTVTVRVVCTVAGPDLGIVAPAGAGGPWQELARDIVRPDGSTAIAIDFRHGTCIVPQEWEVVAERSGCLIVERRGGGTTRGAGRA